MRTNPVIAAVTGASGHLGNVLLRELSRRGVRVNALFRSDPPFEVPAGVKVFRGDLGDPDALRETFAEADVVYHAAGLVSLGIGGRRNLTRTNVEGTRQVIKACVDVGRPRLVYISSVEALNLDSGGSTITEDSGIEPDKTLLLYGWSKALATLEVEAAAKRGDLDAVTIFPTGFVGPHDYKMTPMTSMVRDYLAKKVPAGLAGAFYFVDVRDVAGAAIAAAERGDIGDRFLVPGNLAAVQEIFLILEEITGIRAPRIQIPKALYQLVGFVAELYYAVLGKQPRYTRGTLKLLTLGVSIDGSRAREKLGYRPRDLKVSISDTVEWVRAQMG